MSAIHRIAECAVQTAGLGRIVTQVGPFRACLDPSTDLIWLNYVIPVWALGTPEETVEQLIRLRDLFTENRRTLRFEFVDGIWPGLPEILEQFGLKLQMKAPFMTCTPESFTPVAVPGMSMRWVAAEDVDLQRIFLAIQRDGFGADDEGTDADLMQLNHQIENGFWRCAVGYLDGQPVSIGTIVCSGAVGELAGVATIPTVRRRGAAATLSSFLLQAHFSDGGDLMWLSAMSEIAQAAYRKIGFSDAGVQWNYIAAS